MSAAGNRFLTATAWFPRGDVTLTMFYNDVTMKPFQSQHHCALGRGEAGTTNRIANIVGIDYR